MSIIIIIKYKCDNYKYDSYKCDRINIIIINVIIINIIIIIRHECDNYFKRLNMNRDLYVKIVREKIFKSCDLIIKNVTHLKKIGFKILYVFIFICICHRRIVRKRLYI